jgi:dTDP-4-dehydrorhamnose reductase
MLGSALASYLTPLVNEVVEINRNGFPVVNGNRALKFDANDTASIRAHLEKENFDYVVNAIGIIKQRIINGDDRSAEAAFKVNSDLPRELARISAETSVRIIQIGTDCVYSGLKGNYSEASEFDAKDVYGLSKISGEEESKTLMTIRCSIIGHELNSNFSLMDWFLTQKNSAVVNGYTNHYWNGVTTLAFARVVHGVISKNTYSPQMIHLLPRDQISKIDLLKLLALYFDRSDIQIREFNAGSRIDRTLTTLFPMRNELFWLNAGYSNVPSISDLIEEYADWF